MKKLTVTALIIPDGRTLTVVGRSAWALQNLVQAGKAGCTPIDHPGPRWAHYVLCLRKAGLLIETIHESHGGPFPGHHARYVLRSDVQLVDEQSEAA